MSESKFKYGDQATILLENMHDFDKEAFEKWFESRLSIGSNNILEYLMFKRKIGEEKKRLEDLENGNTKL